MNNKWFKFPTEILMDTKLGHKEKNILMYLYMVRNTKTNDAVLDTDFLCEMLSVNQKQALTPYIKKIKNASYINKEGEEKPLYIFDEKRIYSGGRGYTKVFTLKHPTNFQMIYMDHYKQFCSDSKAIIEYYKLLNINAMFKFNAVEDEQIMRIGSYTRKQLNEINEYLIEKGLIESIKLTTRFKWQNDYINIVTNERDSSLNEQRLTEVKEDIEEIDDFLEYIPEIKKPIIDDFGTSIYEQQGITDGYTLTKLAKGNTIQNLIYDFYTNKGLKVSDNNIKGSVKIMEQLKLDYEGTKKFIEAINKNKPNIKCLDKTFIIDVYNELTQAIKNIERQENTKKECEFIEKINNDKATKEDIIAYKQLQQTLLEKETDEYINNIERNAGAYYTEMTCCMTQNGYNKKQQLKYNMIAKKLAMKLEVALNGNYPNEESKNNIKKALNL